MTAVLGMLWARVAPYVMAAGAILAAVVTFSWSQRRTGRQQERARQTERALEHAEIRRDVEDAVRRDGGGAADGLRDWYRD